MNKIDPMLKDRLREALAAAPDKDQAGLARFCGIKEPSVTNWFNGRTKSIKGQNLLRAATYLGVSPEWLASGRGHKKPDSARTENNSHDMRPLSETILHEAFTLLLHDEQMAGPYPPRARTRRLAELYEWVQRDGGILSDESNGLLIQQINARQQGAANNVRSIRKGDG